MGDKSAQDVNAAIELLVKQAEALPPRWEIRINLSQAEAAMELIDPDGNEVEHGEISEDAECKFLAAIETAHQLDELRPECRECGGHGVVLAWSGSALHGSLEMTADDCPECHGTGLKKH